jgi:hypothetical protein
MTKDEALKLALEALKQIDEAMPFPVAKLAQKVIKEALAQPEFIKHEVKNADDWSEWVCPDSKNYLMKCCDCGLVHEAQFGVVRYKSETEREDCDIVDDPNLQAVFRMRRSEEWTPEDTAHRSGGLPMAQPEQEPVGEIVDAIEGAFKCSFTKMLPVGTKLYTTPPQRKPLTDEKIYSVLENLQIMYNRPPTTDSRIIFARAIEAAHGIKGKA